MFDEEVYVNTTVSHLRELFGEPEFQFKNGIIEYLFEGETRDDGFNFAFGVEGRWRLKNSFSETDLKTFTIFSNTKEICLQAKNEIENDKN